ncbi:MAG TPA: hypothetical protein VF541_17875, partial [Longimicrobium sp.]
MQEVESMRSKHRSLAILAFVVAAAAACSDSGTLPQQQQGSTARRALNNAPATPGQPEVTYTIGVKKNGRLKRYRVKVKRDAHTLNISSLTQACDLENDTDCTRPCDRTADLCEDTIPVDEPVDGRIFVGDVDPSVQLAVAECPAQFSGGSWVGWRGHNFIIWGEWVRQKSLRSWPFGKAEYAIPAGPWESDDDMAIIYNGVVLGSCYGGYERGEFQGIISFSWLRGDAHELSDNSGGGGGGWGGSGGDGTGATAVDASMG